MRDVSQAGAPERAAVLTSGSERLVIRASFLQQLVDTAQALEGEVSFLRLRTTFELSMPEDPGPASAGEAPHTTIA